jgi:nucleoid DNA-binding protein
MISKYIAQLLSSNNRVILPGQGAFMVRNDPSKALYYNEFLKFNDGLLANHIAISENISVEESMVKIKEYLQEINDTIALGKSFKIGELGSFVRDEKGKLQFIPGVGEPTIKINDLSDNKAIIDDENADSIEFIQDSGIISKPDFDEQKKVEDRKLVVEQEKPAERTKTVKRQSTETSKPLVQSSDSTKAKTDTAVLSTVKVITAPQIKSGRTSFHALWLIILAAVLLVVVFFWIFLYHGSYKLKTKQYSMTALFSKQKDSNSSTVPKEKKMIPLLSAGKNLTTENKNTNKTGTPKTLGSKGNATTLGEPKEKTNTSLQKNKNESEVITSTKKEVIYYIVGGAFKNEINAERYVSSLSKKGFQVEKIMKYGDFYLVSYSAFVSRKDAENELNSLKSKGITTVWLLKMNSKD